MVVRFAYCDGQIVILVETLIPIGFIMSGRLAEER